ncbi:MAG: Lpg1974 family pore-forming outer membrane protein [Rhabdochlamydiaceae bacterium]|nr:Lpg1974 family pore-forming outer membrane protein [Candidatus Amphrikana amoebophyrae]
MKNTFKKWLPVLGVFTCSLAFAATNTDSSSYDSSMMNQQKATKTNKMYKEITPPAGPNVDNGVGFSIYADYILWEARAGGLEAAQTGVSQTAAGVSTLTKGQTFAPGFKYQSGFQVGASAELGHDNWTVDTKYTWLHTSDKRTSFGSATAAASTMQAIYMTAPASHVLTTGNTEWNLRFNAVQLNLGRDFLVSENLSLRPYYGIRGAWHNQRQNTNYTFSNTTSGSTGTQDWNVWTKQNWWGVGFQTGLDTGWWFDENWAIYANFGSSLLWGRWNVQNREKKTDVDPDTYKENWASTAYGVQPTLDLEMGVRWMMSFDDNTYAFLVQAGWEQQVWINHQQLNPIATAADDLSLQGFNFRARFYF